jgi:hypothetical protein
MARSRTHKEQHGDCIRTINQLAQAAREGDEFLSRFRDAVKLFKKDGEDLFSDPRLSQHTLTTYGKLELQLGTAAKEFKALSHGKLTLMTIRVLCHDDATISS